MIRHIILRFLVVFLFVSAVCHATPITEIPPRLQRLHDAIANVAGTFHQVKHLSDVDIDIASSGTFSLEKESKFTWHTKAPLDQCLVATPTNIVIIADGVRTEKALHALRVGKGFEPLLAGKLDSLFDSFSVMFDDAPVWRLTLTPKTAEIKSVLRAVIATGNDTFLSTVLLQYASGDTITICFTVP